MPGDRSPRRALTELASGSRGLADRSLERGLRSRPDQAARIWLRLDDYLEPLDQHG
jgi:hypothetical protein